MTHTLSVQTNDVLGFCPFTYTHHGPRTDCGYLFAARHVLHVYIEDSDYQVLAGANGSATLLQVSLSGRAGILTLAVPDFKNGPVFPFERSAVRHDVNVTVSGDAVVRRTGTSPVMYEVVVGMLRCAFEPMFEALRDAQNKPSALTSFWPSLPAQATYLDYVFTAYGLGLQGPLDMRTPDQRDILLLPRYVAGAVDGDAAWRPIPNDAKLGTHTWERLDSATPVPMKPNRSELIDVLKVDAPDPGAWPGTEPRGVMLRWRLMTPERQPFLDQCFANVAAAVRLERRAAESASGDALHAELVCQLWVDGGGTKLRLEHGGMVCTVVGTALTAQFTWSKDERNSLLTARTARAGLWVSGSAIAEPGALFKVVHRTLRTSAAASGGQPNLALTWEPDDAPSTASIALAPTGMLCGGMTAGSASIDPPSERPGWLMLERGCLQLGQNAVPLDGDERKEAAALLSAAADGSQVFRGGLPLAALGGPVGLTAWVSNGTNGAEAEVVLRIDGTSVTLHLYDAILVWRTPGWWVCAASPAPAVPAVPPLAAPFTESLAAAPASRADTDRQLGHALGSVLFPALWVGRAGGIAPRAWPLDIQNGKFRFILPAEAVRASVLWSAFHDAYFVQTVPAGGQALGGPLLDPARALVPLTHASGVALELVPSTSGLPRLATSPYPSPAAMPTGWRPAGGEFFHPNIAGLTLDATLAHYTYRHGPPILVDGYLRARLDGGFASTVAAVSIGAVRAADDVAIDKIDLAVQPNEAYRVRGWLAAPNAIPVKLANLALGGSDPQLTLVASGGEAGAEQLKVRIASRADGFDPAVAVVERGGGATPYLTSETQRGRRLRNFGQSLVVDAVRGDLGDGRGRRWLPFADESRTVSAGALPETHVLLTQRRQAVLDCGLLGSTELSLSLADLEIGAPPHGGRWDLSGRLEGYRGSRPAIGPFVVHADALIAVSADAAEVKGRLGGPVDGPDLPAGAAGGALALRWTKSPSGWTVALADGGTFEWTFDAVPGPDPCIAKISGVLSSKNDRVAVVVSEVSLHTRLGIVTMPCVGAPVEYVIENGMRAGLAFPVATISGSGLTAAFTLQYLFGAAAANGWRIASAGPDPAVVKWEGADGGLLELDLCAGTGGAIRFTDASTGQRVRNLTLAQAGVEHWLALADDGNGIEFAGCLERAEPNATTSARATQLRLAYRWTERWQNAVSMFGPLEPESWVRVKGSASWQSRAWNGKSEPVQRTLSAHLRLENDYAFAFTQPDGTVVTMQDHVHCYVDELPLDPDGQFSGGVIHAMVEHRFHADATGTVTFAFQVPQAIRVVSLPEGGRGLAANAVILLRSRDDAPMPAVAPQVLYAGDETLGVCMGASTPPERVRGVVLRLPLRTGQGKALLRVPAARLPDLVWFPLAPHRTPDLEVPDNGWQERRALASALEAGAIEALCGAPLAPTFVGGATLPADGDALPEWGALAQASGWLHSGLLSEGIGVRTTLYYAGIAQAEADLSAETIPVALYVPDPGSPGGLRQVARALVNDGAKVGEWGASEMLRRSLRTSALVLAHGRPALSAPVLRRFVAAAVDDETPAPAPFDDGRDPPFSDQLGFLRPAEAAGTVPQVLTARTDQDAVLEIVDAQPLVDGTVPVLRFRLALNHLVHEPGRTALVGPTGAALAKRQWLDAEQARAQAPASLPLLSPPATLATHLVSPPLVDVHAAVLRPGDTVQTRWALGGTGGDTGPSVEAGLRCARAGNGVGRGTVTLKIGVQGRAQVDGVDWMLQGVTAARTLGPVPSPIAGTGIETIVVTPSETAHRLLTLVDHSGVAPKLTLGVAATEMGNEKDESTAEHDVSFRLLDPLFCAAFPHAAAALLPEGVELAWAVAAGDDIRLGREGVDPASVSTPDEIEASARTLAVWNAGQQIRVVRLGEWRPLVDTQASENVAQDPAGYSLAPGAALARLLQLTTTKRGAPRHWLQKESLAAGPLLVLLVRSGALLRSLVVHAVDWHRGAALAQPERVLAVRAGQVLGFGDLAGPTGIRLENDHFVLYKTAYALDLAVREDNAAPEQAWLFGPDGACDAMSA